MNRQTIAVTTEGIVHGISIKPRMGPLARILLLRISAMPMPRANWITTTKTTKTKVLPKYVKISLFSNRDL